MRLVAVQDSSLHAKSITDLHVTKIFKMCRADSANRDSQPDCRRVGGMVGGDSIDAELNHTGLILTLPFDGVILAIRSMEGC